MSERWTAGIGDPTFAGWVTVAAYFLAALLSARTQRYSRNGDRGWWLGLACLMLFMGLNRQLDFQSLLTQIARDVAQAQGWYDHRARLQLVFILAMAITGLALASLLFLTIGRRARAQVNLSIAAVCLLGVFIVVRAASFHHVDAMHGSKWAGLRFNTIMELGPLLLICYAAWQAPRTLGRTMRHAKRTDHRKN